MTDVPEIPQLEIQQRQVAMWLGSFYRSSGHVARRLGKGALLVSGCRRPPGGRQLQKARALRAEGPAIATNDKSLFGREVAVVEEWRRRTMAAC